MQQRRADCDKTNDDGHSPTVVLACYAKGSRTARSLQHPL